MCYERTHQFRRTKRNDCRIKPTDESLQIKTKPLFRGLGWKEDKHMTETKKKLINKLVKLYPYSKSWFEQKKESILWAMLNSYKPPRKVVEPIPIREINGEKYIKTDSGNWELVID